MNRAANDTAIARAAVGLLVAIAIALGGWNLTATIANANSIRDERADRLSEVSDLKERLARIEENTKRLLAIMESRQ